LKFYRANNHPSIKWGQKKDHILLTIAVQDIDKPEINIEPIKLQFKYIIELVFVEINNRLYFSLEDNKLKD